MVGACSVRADRAQRGDIQQDCHVMNCLKVVCHTACAQGYLSRQRATLGNHAENRRMSFRSEEIVSGRVVS